MGTKQCPCSLSGKANKHTIEGDSEEDLDENLEGEGNQSDSDDEEHEEKVGESDIKDKHDILESAANDDEIDDNESDKNDDKGDEEGDDIVTADDDHGDQEEVEKVEEDPTTEDKTEVDIEDEEVHSDYDQKVSDGESSDEDEFRELPVRKIFMPQKIGAYCFTVVYLSVHLSQT